MNYEGRLKLYMIRITTYDRKNDKTITAYYNYLLLYYCMFIFICMKYQIQKKTIIVILNDNVYLKIGAIDH